MDRQIVKVYVRAGDHEGERTLSFRPPKEVPQSEWLKRGFAIDGNSVIASVSALTGIAPFEDIPGIPSNVEVIGRRPYPRLHTDPKEVRGAGFFPRTLVQALQEVEAWLVEWLGELGYDVEFA